MRLFWLRVYFTEWRAKRALGNLVFNEKMWCLKFKSESKNTPRNCIAGMSSSLKTLLISLILAARSWSSLLLLQNILNVCFAVDLVNKRNFVLSGWSTKRFRRKNSQILRNSSLAIQISSSRFSWVIRRVGSSANKRARNLEKRGRSFMKRIKSKGPKTEPWGTPKRILSKGLELLLITIQIVCDR